LDGIPNEMLKAGSSIVQCFKSYLITFFIFTQLVIFSITFEISTSNYRIKRKFWKKSSFRQQSFSFHPQILIKPFICIT
jgi:hypothetical protein